MQKNENKKTEIKYRKIKANKIKYQEKECEDDLILNQPTPNPLFQRLHKYHTVIPKLLFTVIQNQNNNNKNKNTKNNNNI